MELNILNFKKLVIQRIAILMFKNSLNMVPKLIGLLFTKNCHIHNHKTSQNRSLAFPYGKVTCFPHANNVWNTCDLHVCLNKNCTLFPHV